jgi:uncharacterized protein (DUF1778 family)
MASKKQAYRSSPIAEFRLPVYFDSNEDRELVQRAAQRAKKKTSRWIVELAVAKARQLEKRVAAQQV